MIKISLNPGDSVIVFDWGKSYTTNSDIAIELGLKKWSYGDEEYCKVKGNKYYLETECTVVSVYDRFVGVLAPNGKEYVVGIEGIKINNNNKIMNLFKEFKNMFVKEPQKSYRALNIVDENDMPTQDGIALYVSHKLNHPTESKSFVDEVVTPLMAAKNAEDKKNG